MKDLLHDIINIYEVENELYPTVYRYVSMREAENLFDKHQLYFTNTASWAVNASKDSGDPTETLFENWWLDYGNLENYIMILYDWHCKKQKHFNLPCDIHSFVSEFSSHLSKYMSIQNDTYSYCTAGNWNDIKMIDEYHQKWKRNVVFEYKKLFHHDIAVMHKQTPLTGDVLCADVFKMTYVPSITEFINNLAQTPISSDLGKRVYNMGTFIKHDKYLYEREQRIKVQLLSSDVVIGKCNVGTVHTEIFGLQTLKEVIDKSMELLKEVRQEFLMKGQLINDLKYFDATTNTEYLVLNDITPKIVEKIYLFNAITIEDKKKIYHWASKYGIDIVELGM